MKAHARLIEKIALGAVALIAAAVVLGTLLSSFFSWKKVFDAAKVKPERPPKTVLQSIDAALAEGKFYFDNNLASVKNDDLIVTAHYLTGEEESDEVIAPDKYDVSVPSDFTANGGTVTVTYKGKKATLEIALVQVALDRLEMTQAPFTVAYKTGDRFSYEGMEIYAVYNDGSRKLITATDYVTDIMTPLAVDDTVHSVAYTDGEVTKTLDVPIKVADDFNNGRVESIAAAAVCYADQGDDISKLVPSVKRIYASGNSELTSDFTVTNESEAVCLGKSYTLNVVYNGDTRKKAEIPVIVRAHIEAETATIVGGKTNSEASYVFEKGKFTPTGETPSFAGAFANAVKGGKEASISFDVTSHTDCTADIMLNCGNSYITRDDDGHYWMQPLQINTIMDMTVNGESVPIGNDVVLKGCGPSEQTGGSASVYAPLYGVYYTFTFGDVALECGINTVKLSFKNSTENAMTCWSESPSTMNVDWINIDVEGSKVSETAEIEDIEISENFSVGYGDDINETLGKIAVVGITSDGNRILLGADLYNLEVAEGTVSEGYFELGDYVLKATLKADETVSADLTFNIDYKMCLVKEAYVEISGERVYWVFVFDNVGYAAEDYEFFEGTTVLEATSEIVGKRAVFKIDVTEIDETKFNGGMINPHLRLCESNYSNGANSNGDLRGDQLVYTDGQSVTLGDRVYTIKTNYSMPSLVITRAA